MRITARHAALPLALAALAACDSQVEREEDAIEDQVEQQAEASAVAAGGAIAALGLTEARLLEADLVAADGTDLGDVEQLHRNGSGTVDGLLVEVEDSDPDRYVVVPLDGLTTRADGDDVDIQAAMTATDIEALPDADPTAGATPAAEPIAQ